MEELPPLFAAGQRLGRYELLRRLAVGGMAEVYLAYAVGPGDFRKVMAIKRLLPQHALDPQLLRMFLDEARLMARLSHPHVPQVTDVDDGTGGSVPYFVMEYIHGTDLRGVLNAAGGPLPLEQALAITGAVAAGLHHAHQLRGASGQPLEIVHRDVSPSNVLISFDGAVKITDFGVAKWTEQKSFTHHGQLKGKIAHMSPEQCRGETLDRRSDVFALGTLLYEMTAGHPPFQGDSEYDLLTQIVSKEAAAPRRPGEVYPVHLEAVLMKALRRDREQRHATTQELQLELEAFARERRLVISPVSLAAYLEALFGAQVTEWRQALASGSNLADHLAARGDGVGGSGNADGPRGAAAFTGPEKQPGAVTRTATDAFAVAVGPSAADQRRDPALVSPPTRAGGTSSPEPATPASGGSSHRGRVGIRRVVAFTAAAAAALALLMAATELTSRWQRGSQTPSVTPLSPAAPVTAPPADRSAAPGAAAALSPTALFIPVSAPRREKAPLDSAAPPAPPPRKGRDPNVRTGRRDSAGGAVARSKPEVAPQRPGATLPQAASGPAGEADASPRAGAAVPTAARQQTPAAAPVKVWDPDSPVPP